MLYNIGYTNTMVIYCHSTVITKVILIYNTEWWYDHGMAVNYCGKKFYNIKPWPHPHYSKKIQVSALIQNCLT